jgi:hypothetical protein
MRSACYAARSTSAAPAQIRTHTMDNFGIASPAIPSAVPERRNRNKLRRFIVVIDIWIPHFEIHALKNCAWWGEARRAQPRRDL